MTNEQEQALRESRRVLEYILHQFEKQEHYCFEEEDQDIREDAINGFDYVGINVDWVRDVIYLIDEALGEGEV